MKQVIVLIRETQPGEHLSSDPLDLREATMSVLDRCRELGYAYAEGVVTDDNTDILEHVLLNTETTVLRADGPSGNRRLVSFEL